MIDAIKGMAATLLCETTDRATDRPKTNVTGAQAVIYGRTPAGAEEIIAAVPMAVHTGYTVAAWYVPLNPGYEAGFVEYILTDDSDDSPFTAREDIAFRDEPATAEQMDALVELATFLFEAGSGSWNVDRATGIVTYYRPDGFTPLARWQLLDKFGEPTRIPGNAYGRRRIP